MKKIYLLVISIILICSIFLVSFASAGICDDARKGSIDPESSCRVVEGGTIWLKRDYCNWKPEYINFKGRCSNTERGTITWDSCSGRYEVITVYIRGCKGCNDYDSSTTMNCGTIDCDYKDTACRDYPSALKRECDDGACHDMPCDSYTPINEGKSCGTGKVCRSGNCVPCQCTSGPCCDGCNYRPTSYVCRAASGDCDIAETCTGSSATCPADFFQQSLCEPCQLCSNGTCVVGLYDDPRCGTIDCSGWYIISPTVNPSPDTLQQCWSFADITEGRCKSGECKVSNSFDCELYEEDSTQRSSEYECGECRYIAAGGCSGTNKSRCTYYAGQRCYKGEECGACDKAGTGTCVPAENCEDGTSIGVCSEDKDNIPKYCNLCGILEGDHCDECGAFCPDGRYCQASGCINPDTDCSSSDFDNENDCDSEPGCFWNGIGVNCSSCTDTGITGCDSYTKYGNATCKKDICNIARQSSCGWNSTNSTTGICFKLTENCYSLGDEDNNGKADCEDSACDSLSFCQSSGICGDSVINPGEECDRDNIPYGMNCSYFGLGSGNLTCIPRGGSGECKFNFSNCDYQTPPGFNLNNCNNSLIDSGEICDTSGPKLGNKTCEDFGFFSGDLKCFFCTRLGTSNCLGTVSKEGNAAACIDTFDNDYDDYTDYMDSDCQVPPPPQNPHITRTGGNCTAGVKKAIASLEYTYILRFDLGTETKTKEVEITCPVPIAARLPFFSLLSFLITVILLFAYYLLREKKAFNV